MNKTLYTISPGKQIAITKLSILVAHQTSLITCYNKWVHGVHLSTQETIKTL